jgi:hypothetical protein
MLDRLKRMKPYEWIMTAKGDSIYKAPFADILYVYKKSSGEVIEFEIIHCYTEE